MAFQQTKYRVIGAGGEGDEEVVERFRLAEAKAAGDEMLGKGLRVRIIKVVQSVHAVREPGGKF